MKHVHHDIRTRIIALSTLAILGAAGCGGDSNPTSFPPESGTDAASDGSSLTTDGSTGDDAPSTDAASSDATSDAVSDSASATDAASDAASDSASDSAGDAAAPTIGSVGHVIVIYMENHSFDNLYGGFAGANGLFKADGSLKDEVRNKQLDPKLSPAAPYATLPENTTPVYGDAGVEAGAIDATSAIPLGLPNQPFDIAAYEDLGVKTIDLVHRFWNNQMQIHGGANDLFVGYSDANGLSLGYYQTSRLPVAAEAAKFVLCDNFYQGAFGGSFLNHQFLVAAAAPAWDTTVNPIPASYLPTLDSTTGMLKVDPTTGKPIPVSGGADKVTPAGWNGLTAQYGVNTLQPYYTPHAGGSSADKAKLIPPLKNTTIGDLLTAKGVDWAWYAGGWNDALAGSPDPLFQFHHQPFVYFDAYKDGSAAKTAHLKDEADFVAALAAGTLPPVAFVKPIGANNEHPGYTDLLTGENHLKDLLTKIYASSVWKDAVVIITYDENGGFYDHAAPPAGKTDGTTDIWGPGSRVPAIVISPFAKKSFIDHTAYDTTSILAFIEKRFGLAAIGTRDAAVAPLSGAFVF